MFPVTLTLAGLTVALIGEGRGLHKRYAQLCEAGAVDIHVFTKEGAEGIATEHLACRRYPQEIKAGAYHCVMAVDIPAEDAERIAAAARAVKTPVNVEDVMHLCDFYFCATFRRGDLLFAINTGGKSPALAVRIKEWLSAFFPEIWAERLEILAQKRVQMRAEGKNFAEVIAGTRETLEANDWKPRCDACPHLPVNDT